MKACLNSHCFDGVGSDRRHSYGTSRRRLASARRRSRSRAAAVSRSLRVAGGDLTPLRVPFGGAVFAVGLLSTPAGVVETGAVWVTVALEGCGLASSWTGAL